MAAADINNEELLFVTSYWADAVRTIIYRVRPQPGSTPEEVVMLPGVFAGIAVDSHEKTAYLVDSLTSDVYALPLGSEARPSARFILTIRNAVQCGPVALDRGSQELLVGDPIGGLMYSVDLKRRKAAAFASKVGEPRAMAVDEVKRILFVVDAANRRVLALSLGDRGSRPAPLVTFWTNKLLREPSGVALAKDGRIWVCDQSTGRIFHVR
jgi:sugar lactone lactonase YvrE